MIASKKQWAGLVVLFSTLAGPGCVATTHIKDLCLKEKCPKGVPCQVVVRWEPELIQTPDPTRGGAPNSGLACRVYLFGPNIDYPMGCDGSVGVELFNVTGGAPATKPLETWQIDPVTMERLCRKDAIGWGYTLFLPSERIQPGVREVRLRTRFVSDKGQVLYHDSGPIKLHNMPVVQGPRPTPGIIPAKPQNTPLPEPTPLPTLPTPKPNTQGASMVRGGR